MKTSTKAVTVGTERGKNLRGQGQRWFVVIRLLREKAEELRRAPVPCFSLVQSGWWMPSLEMGIIGDMQLLAMLQCLRHPDRELLQVSLESGDLHD